MDLTPGDIATVSPIVAVATWLVKQKWDARKGGNGLGTIIREESEKTRQTIREEGDKIRHAIRDEHRETRSAAKDDLRDKLVPIWEALRDRHRG